MSRSFFTRLSLSYIADAMYERNFVTPTRQERKKQLAEATLSLARANNRSEAREVRKRIDMLLGELQPALHSCMTRAHASSLRAAYSAGKSHHSRPKHHR